MANVSDTPDSRIERVERKPPLWHPIWRYRAWKVRHMIGEWWVDGWILREKKW